MGISFDTNVSNTGYKSGACVMLEKSLERNLLYLACRHHIYELIIGEVFNVLLGPSTGPNISLFERFKKCWSSIDQSNFKGFDHV